jgi:hypothetical protein
MDQVVAANSIKNPFEDIAKELDIFNSKGISFKISFQRIEDISMELINEFLKLIESNVGNYFKSSKRGWNKRIKMRDLTSKNASYLIAKVEDSLAGFSMLKFDLDYKRAVLYW